MLTENMNNNYKIIMNLSYLHLESSFSGNSLFSIYTLPSEWNKLEDSRFQYNRITFQIEIKNKLLEQLNEE